MAGESEKETKERTMALQFLDAPSDLIPGVYEGGLKTWECSLDLVDYLDSIENGDVRGKRVLEVRLHVVLVCNFIYTSRSGVVQPCRLYTSCNKYFRQRHRHMMIIQAKTEKRISMYKTTTLLSSNS